MKRTILSTGGLLLSLLLALGGCERSDPPATSSAIPPTATTSPGKQQTPGKPDVATSPLGANLLINPGFEAGDAPWTSLSTPAWSTPFTVSREAAHGGQHSARLALAARPEAGAKIWGVVQDVKITALPARLSGHYRVAEWTRGSGKQYIQFVVIVFAASNAPMGFPNHQIRYLLAGTDTPPFKIGNAKFVYVGTEEPKAAGWIHFERDLHQDFIDQWGAVPENISGVRLLYEVRYDHKRKDDTNASALVYFDDLYLGDAGANPNPD